MALTHLIIGAGNMGGSLLSGWLRDGLVSRRNVAILDPRPGTEAVYAIERGAKHIRSADDIPKSVKVVLLAIKPQMFADLRGTIGERLPKGATLISIMAGITLADLQACAPQCEVIRAMPNTPASIGRGITGYVANEDVLPETLADAEALLGACGEVVRVETDALINAVTAISGSGPAYVFHLCEALASAGKAVGLAPETAAKLARQTVIGASALLDESESSPAALREAVTSPGGTTQAALDVLMGDDGMTQLMRRAAKAALERSRELSR